MKYTKILSLLAAASMAVSPASMTVYAEGDNTNDKPAQTEQTPSEEAATTTTTTAAATTEITTTAATTTAEVTTTTADIAASTTKPTTTATKKVTTTTKPKTTTTTTATTTEPVTTTATTTSPADNAVVVKPVCEHFIKNDVNGELRISVPEDATAKVDVVYESPEYDKHEYYNCTLEGGEVYSLAIEGRDTTEDDYRNYTVSISLTGGIYGITSDSYTEKFNVADKNDNPDSFKSVSYILAIDNVQSTESFDITTDRENLKRVAFHLNYVMLGDVNDDSVVNSSDASIVLAEYAKILLITHLAFTITKPSLGINSSKGISFIPSKSSSKFSALNSPKIIPTLLAVRRCIFAFATVSKSPSKISLPLIAGGSTPKSL